MSAPRAQGLVPHVHTGRGARETDHILGEGGSGSSRSDEGHVQARSAQSFLLFTNTQQSFKFSSFIERGGEGRGGDRRDEHNPTNRTKGNIKTKRGTKIQNETNPDEQHDRIAPRTTELTESHTFAVCTSITEVAPQGGGVPRVRAWPRPAPTPATHAPRTPTRTDTPAGRRRAQGGGYHQSASSSM